HIYVVTSDLARPAVNGSSTLFPVCEDAPHGGMDGFDHDVFGAPVPDCIIAFGASFGSRIITFRFKNRCDRIKRLPMPGTRWAKNCDGRSPDRRGYVH